MQVRTSTTILGTMAAGGLAAVAVDRRDGDVGALGVAGGVAAGIGSLGLAARAVHGAHDLLDARRASLLDVVVNGRTVRDTLLADTGTLLASRAGADDAARGTLQLQVARDEGRGLGVLGTTQARRALAAIIGVAEEAGSAPAQLSRLSVARSTDGMVALWARAAEPDWAAAGVRERMRLVRGLRGRWAAWHGGGERVAGFQHRGVIALDRSTAAGLEQVVSGTGRLSRAATRAVDTLVHESRHAASPLRHLESFPRWLEEGLATAYARHLTEPAAAAAGRRVATSALGAGRTDSYARWAAAAEQVATRAGHPLHTSAGRAGLDDALRGAVERDSTFGQAAVAESLDGAVAGISEWLTRAP